MDIHSDFSKLIGRGSKLIYITATQDYLINFRLQYGVWENAVRKNGQALLDRGYSADDIRKILGGNTLRVFAEVERVSNEMKAH